MPGVRVTRGGRGRGRVLPHRGSLHRTPQVRVVLERLPSGQLPPPPRRRLVPTRGRGYRGASRVQLATGSRIVSDENLRLEALQTLCVNLKDKYDEKLKEVRAEAAEKVAEENAILQYRLNSSINTHLAQLEEAKSSETFKFNASGAAIQRIVEVRKKVREAVTEGERDFEDFHETKTGKVLLETLDLLDEQEGLIRFAESSKFGFRVLDKIHEEKPQVSSLIKDQNLLDRLKESERRLEKEDKATEKREPRRRNRSRSRSRSLSNRRSYRGYSGRS